MWLRPPSPPPTDCLLRTLRWGSLCTYYPQSLQRQVGFFPYAIMHMEPLLPSEPTQEHGTPTKIQTHIVPPDDELAAGPDGDASVSVSSLLDYLTVDIEKRSHMHHLPLYLVFLFVVSLLTGLTTHALRHETYSEAFLLNQKVADDLAPGSAVDTPAGLYAWLSHAASVAHGSRMAQSDAGGASCSPTGKGGANAALGTLLIRQWRVRETDCSVSIDVAHALPPVARGAIPCACSDAYSEVAADRAAFGDGNVTFLSDAGLVAAVRKNVSLSERDRMVASLLADHGYHPQSVTTRRRVYDDPSAQYSRYIDLGGDTSAADVQQEVHSLQEGGYIDAATRLVSFDVLFYNADTGLFTRTSCHVEFFQTGAVETGCHSGIFLFRSVPGTDLDGFLFFLDVLLTVFCASLLYSLISYVKLKLELRPSRVPITAWTVYETAHIVVMVMLLKARWDLWQAASNVSYDGDAGASGSGSGGGGGGVSVDNSTTEFVDDFKAFHFLSAYSAVDRRVMDTLAVATIMSYLRVFKYFQHFSLLNMLSETIRYAAHDILRLAVIFGLVLLGYALCGVLLFSTYIREMETLIATVSWLLRILFMQYEFDWEPLTSAQPVWASFFMGSYFVVCYLLLLNMLLAVVVNAFDHVRKSHELAERSRQQRTDDRTARDLEVLKKTYESTYYNADIDDELRAVQLGMGYSRRRSSCIVSTCGHNTLTRVVAVIAKRVRHAYNEAARRAQKSRSTGFRTAMRVQTVWIVKKHCASESSIPLDELEENPCYYSRFYVTLAGLRTLTDGLLDDSDLRKIFEGIKKKTSEEAASVPLLLSDLSDRLAAMEARATDRSAQAAQIDALQERLGSGATLQAAQSLSEREKHLAARHKKELARAGGDREVLAREVKSLQAHVSLLQKALHQAWHDAPQSPTAAALAGAAFPSVPASPRDPPRQTQRRRVGFEQPRRSPDAASASDDTDASVPPPLPSQPPPRLPSLSDVVQAERQLGSPLSPVHRQALQRRENVGRSDDALL